MAMRPAQYLLRFDDLCPTMSRSGWQRFEALIDEFGVRPMLAVVPDNGDPELEVEDADAEFWAKMRAREAEGAAIALHGYRHVCASRSGECWRCMRIRNSQAWRRTRSGDGLGQGSRFCASMGSVRACG
jgi:predicted deacetylase